MYYYARVVFARNASVTERHHDVGAARCWIEYERDARPELFCLGQIFEATPDRDLVATIDLNGWRSLQP
jgi:hypothetical protein